VIGVMPQEFWFESKEVEVWLPRPMPRAEGAYDARALTTIARLAPGATMQSPQADMQSLALRLARDYPQANAGWDILVTGLLPLGPGEKVFFGLVTTLTSLLLAAACAHIANLLLARGMERRGEVAIRASLGARRGRIMRQLFVESVALSIVGGVCSLLIALPIVVGIRPVLGPGARPFRRCSGIAPVRGHPERCDEATPWRRDRRSSSSAARERPHRPRGDD